MDIAKENPVNIKYMKVVRIFLWTIGAWSGEVLGEKVPIIIRYHRIHAPVQGIVITFGEIWYIMKNIRIMSFFVTGHCLIVTFLSVLTDVRCAAPNLKQYTIIFKHFFTEFHLIHHKHKSEYHLKVFSIMDQVSKYFTYYLMGMMVMGLFLFNVSPCYLNYVNGAFSGNVKENFTLEYSVYFILPGFDPDKHFRFTTIYNFYLSYNCACSVCAIDLYLSLMVFQIIGHILTLRNSLENISKPKRQDSVKFNYRGDSYEVPVAMFDEEENQIVLKKLIECVNHHRFILRFTDNISSFFGPILALNYAFHMFSCCLLLLECSQGDPAALFRFGPLTIIIFGQLIQLSVTFEVVDTVSLKLKDYVYAIPWECMNNKNRRIVCFLLKRVQEPMRVTALGVTPVGVTTMAGILKTTFSYFTFLRQMDI